MCVLCNLFKLAFRQHHLASLSNIVCLLKCLCSSEVLSVCHCLLIQSCLFGADGIMLYLES